MTLSSYWFSGDDFPTAEIPLSGDELVRVRMASAKGLRRGAEKSEERFDMLIPVIEDFFHVMQDFLEVNIFYPT